MYIVLSFIRLTPGNAMDSANKPDTDNDDSKQKEKSPKAETSPHTDYSPSASGQPAYVPYALYSKLLERVNIKIIHTLSSFHFSRLHVCEDTRY